MYCPQCGTDSPPNLQYCRGCGANLKVIGKAVALSEAVARSDRGPLPKIKEMVKNFKVEHVTDEVSRALDHMNTEIANMSPDEHKRHDRRPWINLRTKKTPAERREQHISKGMVSMFSGIGLTAFLYYLSASLVLKLPPDVVQQVPFEIESVVRVIWLIGLIPTLSGFGHIVAGLLIRPGKQEPLQIQEPVREQVEFPRTTAPTPSLNSVPRSVTENTTNLLEETKVSTNSR
jgi:hypothetical protein